MKLKYINQNYIPKGQLEGFPLEVIDKMIEKQVEQGNEANVEVFERLLEASVCFGGFHWGNVTEGSYFWIDVINNKNFDLFFEKYPKEDKEELPLPRVIEVRNSDSNYWVKRVVLMFKDNKAICWHNVETLEEAEKVYTTHYWNQWREVQEESKPIYKPFDFSDGIKNHLDLLGKKIFSKDDIHGLIISDLCFENNKSWINDLLNTCDIFESYVFEDGSPVGVKM